MAYTYTNDAVMLDDAQSYTLVAVPPNMGLLMLHYPKQVGGVVSLVHVRAAIDTQ